MENTPTTPDNEAEIQNSTQNEEEMTNLQRLKQKLSYICHKTRFCGICLDIEGLEKMWLVHTKFDIAVGQRTHKKFLKDIIDYVLNQESSHIMASSYLCNHCTEKSIQSYLFIYNARQLSTIIYNCVNELHDKTIKVKNGLRTIDNHENSNAIIVLEQNDKMCDFIDIGKMTEIVAKETSKNEDFESLEEIDKYEIIEPLPRVEKNPLEVDSINLNSGDVHEMKVTYLDEVIDSSIEVDDIESDTEKVLVEELESPSLKKKSLKNNMVTFTCRKCKVILPAYKAWKEHYRNCKKQKVDLSKIFKCKLCNDQFNTQRALNTHYKSHLKIRCKVCQFIVSKEEEIEHMKINHEDYIHFCKSCKFFSYTEDGLKAHIKKLHSGPQCALCLKKVKENNLKLHKCKFNCTECIENVCVHYKYLISFRDQILNKADKPKCLDCDYVCPRREGLLGHINREHLDHHPFTCAHCDQQFYSRSGLRYHINQFHKERYICMFCDQEFFTKLSLDNHVKLCQCIERDFKCDHCTCSFSSLEELANHVKLRHEQDTFNCNLCEKKFLSSVKLQDHTFKVHSGLQLKKKWSLPHCPICNENCENKKQLMDHVKLHPNTRFPCKECNLDFDCIKKLQMHVRIHYDDVIQCVNCKKVLTKTFFPHHMVYCNVGRPTEKVCTCEICGRSYPNEIQLKFHRKVHLDKIPCPSCQKPTRPSYMKGHMKRCKHKPIQPRKPKQKYYKYIKCDWCGHMMSRYTELEAHVNRFHLKVKPYQCTHCKKTFFGKDRLKDHLVTHTSAKVVNCSICNKQFQNNTCLKMHMRKHTGYTPYACEICGERFTTSSIMNTHKVKKHSVRTVACPLCHSMFHLLREMRNHFKKVHWKHKDKKFDPRDVKALSPAFYHLFEDGRLPKVEGEELYISSKCNEKYD